MIRRTARPCTELGLGTLSQLPDPCRTCLFWERGPMYGRRGDDGEPAQRKQEWLAGVVAEFGSAGQVCRADGITAGFAICAPASTVPRSSAFPTSPVSADAVLLTTAHVLPEYAGRGLGKQLVRAVVKQLSGRPGLRAVEAFADARWERPACLLPVGFLEAVGFHVVRQHAHYPRMRLDLRSALTLQSRAELARERVRGLVRPVPRPAAGASSLPAARGREGALKAGL